jgi:hypothetical protein
MHRIATFVGTLLAVAAIATTANASEFCRGFEAGWKAAFQNRGMIVGVTPVCPVPPVGRATFQGGYEMGLLAALSQMPR